MGGLRVAAAVIGGAGAAFGALVYPSAVVLWVAILALSGFLPSVTLVDLAFVGPLAMASLSCLVGAAGAWLVFAGRRTRDALLMLAAAVGVAAAVAAQPLLVDAAGDRGLPERIRDDSEPSRAEYSEAMFAPAAALLVGAALASLAPEGPGGAAARRGGP